MNVMGETWRENGRCVEIMINTGLKLCKSLIEIPNRKAMRRNIIMAVVYLKLELR